MNRQLILDKVYTKTYYIGESKKRENPDMKYVQASSDDADVLSDYMNAEINRLKGYMQKRLLFFRFNGDDFFCVSNRPSAREMVDVINESMETYLVEYITWKWLSDNYPQLADPSAKEETLWSLKDHVCCLAPKVRRRAATMGI